MRLSFLLVLFAIGGELSTACLAQEGAVIHFPVGSTGDAETDAQWGLARINAHLAHRGGFTGGGILVGLLDSGADASHPELFGRVSSKSFDLRGLMYGSSDPVGHGTMVGSVLVGNRDGNGMHGVAYDATLMSVQLSHSDPLDLTFAFSFMYALGMGVDLINASFGLQTYVPLYPDDDPGVLSPLSYTLFAVHEAAGAGILTVWAAGNHGRESVALLPSLPLVFPELESTTLAVTAVNTDGRLAYYANKCGFAARWCLAAPGGEAGASNGIYAARTGGGYLSGMGTSLAAPHVTGGLAIARQMFPQADTRDIRKLILRTALDIGDPGVDPVFGWGLLDLGNLTETISPAGRSIFAAASRSRHMAMAQAARAPFETMRRRVPLNDRLWMSGSFLHSRTSVSPGFPEARASIRTLYTGVDLIDQVNVTAGIGVGYAEVDTSERATANTAHAKGVHGFAYGTWDIGDWRLRASAGVSRFRQTHTRRTIPGLAGTVTALGQPVAQSHNVAHGGFGTMETGYRRAFGWGDATLFAHLSGITQRFGAAHETGLELLGQTVSAGRTTTVETGPGIRLSGRFGLADWEVEPGLELAYARVLKPGAFAVDTTLLGRVLEARAEGVGRDRLDIAAKLDLHLPETGASARIGYAGAFYGAGNQHQVSLGLSVSY